MITIDMSGEYGVTIYVVARRLLKGGADPLAEMCIVRDGVASIPAATELRRCLTCAHNHAISIYALGGCDG